MLVALFNCDRVKPPYNDTRYNDKPGYSDNFIWPRLYFLYDFLYQTRHYNDQVNFATPWYNEDKTSRNLLFPTSKPTFTLCFFQCVVGHDEFSAFKSPFHAFFSHVAFFNLLVVNDEFPLHHSLWDYWTHYCSQHGPWEIIIIVAWAI